MTALREHSSALLVGVLVWGLTACEDDLPTTPPADEVLIEGRITEIGTDVGSSSRFAILVEEQPDDPGVGGYDKVIFYLDAFTPVRSAAGTVPRRIVGVRGLEVGQRVRVWSKGVILDSYPAQTGAAFIEVVCEGVESCGTAGG